MLTNNSNIPTWKIKYVLHWLDRKLEFDYKQYEIEIRQDVRKADYWRGDSRDKIWVEFGSSFRPIAYKREEYDGPRVINPSDVWEYLVVSLAHELMHKVGSDHLNIHRVERQSLGSWREDFPLSRWMRARVWLVSLRAKRNA